MSQMGIVTLLSDFGVRNGYVPAMKGVIAGITAGQAPQGELVLLIGGYGNLELRVDRGSAAARLGSSGGSRVKIIKR